VVRVGNPNLRVKTDGIIRAKDEGDFTSEAIIVAFGSQIRKLGLSGEDTFTGKGISCCATCNGLLFKYKTAGVIDNGDAAITEALSLYKFASSIKVIPCCNQLRANKIFH